MFPRAPLRISLPPPKLPPWLPPTMHPWLHWCTSPPAYADEALDHPAVAFGQIPLVDNNIGATTAFVAGKRHNIARYPPPS